MQTPLYYNEDSTDFFYHADHTQGQGGAHLDAYIDHIAEGGVTTFLCNTNAQRTNYASDVWTPTWEGLDPDGPDDQPYLAGIASGPHPVDVSRWRSLATNMLALHEQGIDYPARVIERCRLRGMTPWITLRMNDVHDQMNETHPIHGRFWFENQHLWRKNCDDYYSRAFDFGHVEVRDYYMALVDETLDRYDMDGLELDFLREPFLFSVGEEEQGRALLTEWVGEIRQRVEAVARKRGHEILLGVRSPSRPDVALAYGMDPVRWAREGWIDLLVISPRWSTIEFAMPMNDWRRRLEGCDVTLAGGLEILRGNHPTAPKRPVTAAEARGAAAQVLHTGADAVYLFNYFPSANPDTIPDAWVRDAYTQTISSLASLERIEALPRTHAITFTDLIGPEGSIEAPLQLPGTGADLFFTLPTGPRPAGGTAELVLGLGLPDQESQDADEADSADAADDDAALTVSVNESGDLEVAWVASEEDIRSIGYILPVDALLDGTQNNHIRLSGPDSLHVEAVEIRISPA
ncbi:MAG: hypothetical protein HN712_27040 [Gemmatimonadetes bacterium]|nr:hypothetical protein [Gemmatimonadota bacterium]MBT7863998.1 hypothetical protein [Gemmatimonadota bacterium]